MKSPAVNRNSTNLIYALTGGTVVAVIAMASLFLWQQSSKTYKSSVKIVAQKSFQESGGTDTISESTTELTISDEGNLDSRSEQETFAADAVSSFQPVVLRSEVKTTDANSGSDTAVADDVAIRHRILICGANTCIVESDGNKSWTYNSPTRDGYVLGDGTILLTLSKSKKFRGGAVVLIDPTRNEEVVLWRGTQSEVNSVQPTSEGTFVLTEAGPKPRLLEIDRDGKTLVEFPLRCQKNNHHMQSRMARKLDDGTYLVPHLLDFAVYQYNSDGELLAKFDTTAKGDSAHKIHTWPFTAIRHSEDRTLVCLTHSNRVVEFDSDGEIAWQLTNDDLPGDWLQDPCGAQVLPNGNFVIASYAAGRADTMAPKLFEVTRDKEVVWTYVDGLKVGVHNFQILSTNGEQVDPVMK